MRKGRIKGNRNPSSMWGTGGTDVTFLTWNPSNDFIPAWIPLSQLERDLTFNIELPQGQFQSYLPLYINNDGVPDSTDAFILELDFSDPSIGFSQETYILQEEWDQIGGDVAPFGASGVFDPKFSRSLPDQSDLGRMFLVNSISQPSYVPRLVAGGRFTEAMIVIEDAQSTTPAIRLGGADDFYIVADISNKPGVDAVFAGAGNDRIIGSNSERGSISSTNQDVLVEKLIADRLFGEAGNDILQGGASDDLLNGGSENDQLFGEAGQDALYGMMGDDILWGDYEENYKDGNNLNESGGERDYLSGGSGNDALFGGAGADLLFGGDGIDYLSAGKKGTTSAHPQWLEGGAGGDRFDFYTDPWIQADPGPDITSSQSAQEQIYILDFNAAEGDKIGIYVGTSYSSSFRAAGLPLNTPIRVDQFHFGAQAADAADRFIYTGGSLYFDPDGTGSAPKVFLAFLNNSPVLSHQDIITFDDTNRLPPPSEPLPPPPSIEFSQPSYQAIENAGTAVLTLSRTGDTKGRSQVQVNVTGGTATNADFTNRFPLTVTFGINETSATISIPIVQDELVEGTETITFSISSINDPTAGTVDTLTGLVNTATLSITDDDGSRDSGPESDTGTAQTKVLRSGKGNNVLRGGNGDEILLSGAGSDRLYGGKGSDVFVLEKGKGRDVIWDFEDKRDRLGLAIRLKYRKLTVTQQGRNTLISLGKDELALVKGIRVNQLTLADFVTVDPSAL